MWVLDAVGDCATSPGWAQVGSSRNSVSKSYRVTLSGGRHGTLRAVDGVSLELPAGRTLGLVGESGSGKSTVPRLLLRLVAPTAGEVFLDGENITHEKGRSLRLLRRRMQIIFQDPYSSFDPLASISTSVSEALRGQLPGRAGRDARAAELLGMVGLSPSLGRRYPSELSGASSNAPRSPEHSHRARRCSLWTSL